MVQSSCHQNFTRSFKNENCEKINDKMHSTYQLLIRAFSMPRSLQKSQLKGVRKALTEINITDTNGKTLLMEACLDNKQDIVCYLLDEYSKDLDINKVDSKGNTALHYACQKARPSIVQKLIKSMRKSTLDINIKNNDGFTPIDIALMENNQCSVEIIVEEGLSRGYNYLKQRPATFNELRYYERLPRILRNMTGQDDTDITSSRQNDKRTRECESLRLPAIPQTIHEENYDSEDENNQLNPKRGKRTKNSKVICSKLLRIRSMQDSSSYREGFPYIEKQKTPLVNINGRTMSVGNSTMADFDGMSLTGNMTRTTSTKNSYRKNSSNFSSSL